MAEPSTLAQTAINVANTDFTQRVTPHPQVASPLQQLIVEDQQAKEDPGDNEIEGLDAEVLLNTDTLEDGEPVTLDFDGQGDPPSMHPPIMQLIVGGITVCYGTCLWSLVLQARVYHCDCIILAFHSTYETWQGYWWSWNFGILKSVPKLVEVLSLNQVNFGDSNGVIHVSIPALGDENRKLLCFLFTFSSLESPWSTGSYYTPLERYE